MITTLKHSIGVMQKMTEENASLMILWSTDVYIMPIYLYYIKQMNPTLPYNCSVINHRSCQNVVRTSVTHLPNGLCTTFLFSFLMSSVIYTVLSTA